MLAGVGVHSDPLVRAVHARPPNAGFLYTGVGVHSDPEVRVVPYTALVPTKFDMSHQRRGRGSVATAPATRAGQGRSAFPPQVHSSTSR